MIILIRSNGVNPDPRLQKYINYLEDTNQTYKVIGWNRQGDVLQRNNYIYFNKKAVFGGGIKNIPKKFEWFLFLIKYLLKNKSEYKVIHACDLDTAIPAYITKIFTKKKIIFDVFDWVSSEDKKGFFRKTLSKVENYIFKKSDYTILCEEYRINQIKKESQRESSILPNIPDISFVRNEFIEETIFKQRQKYKSLLSYVGVFDSNRGIEDLLEVVSKDASICLNIAGFGLLESIVYEYAQKYSNIIFWGKVDYNIGLNIMKNSDLIMAFYYLTNPIHKYAAPNKYYEGLFLGKTIVTNNGTLLSEKIKMDNTGYVIEEGIKSIEQFLGVILDIEDVKVKNKNSAQLWVKLYKNYTAQFMREIYQKMIS